MDETWALSIHCRHVPFMSRVCWMAGKKQQTIAHGGQMKRANMQNGNAYVYYCMANRRFEHGGGMARPSFKGRPKRP